MNILLMLPGLLVLLFQYRGVVGMLESITLMAAVQVRDSLYGRAYRLIFSCIKLALPAPFFLSMSETHLNLAYFNSAFDFSRQFLYEWTVNWKFIDKKTFHSRAWELGLLGGQVRAKHWFSTHDLQLAGPACDVRLVSLVSHPRRYFDRSQAWTVSLADPTNITVSTPIASCVMDHLSTLRRHLDIPLVLFTSNLIGMTFARSLHYQFHTWYFHQIPLLLFAGGAWDQFAVGWGCRILPFGLGDADVHLECVYGQWWNSPLRRLHLRNGALQHYLSPMWCF